MSNTKVKFNKTQSFMTQKGRTHTRKAQPKHTYMYTRHYHNRYATQHNAHKHIAQIYQNAQCYCNYITHSMSYSKTQKSYRKYHTPQNTKHVSYTRKAYHPRVNKFVNVECFYCMTKGHTSNVCFYRSLHLQFFPLAYIETNQPRPTKV